jgi:hypothetical protein
MSTNPPKPKPMGDDESRMEDLPKAVSAEARRKLGKMEDEGSVSISQPSPLKRANGRKVPRGTVGLRAASQREAPPEKVAMARNAAEASLNAKKDERRQKVWDKLDAARKAADERLPRYQAFQPKRER